MIWMIDWIHVLAAFGFLGLIYVFLDTAWNFFQTGRSLLAPYFIQNEVTSLTEKFGQWALVTGCTDGIGKEYSKELAKRGVNIVLVSRNEEKLRKTAKEIEEFSVKTKIIVADFGRGEQVVQHIKDEVGKLPIGILVNNVGTQYTYPMYLGELPMDKLWNIINVNVGAVTSMTRLFVEEMRQRGRGAIVNVSSGSELQPLPLMTIYAASKAYIKSFTQAIRYEYAGSGLTVQHLSPLFVNTKINSFSNRLRTTTLFVPDAASYARYAVAMLGKVDHTTGYWTHGVQYTLIKLAPESLRTVIGGAMNKSFRNEYFQEVAKKE